MIDFIICGCKEVMPETILELVYDRHNTELDMDKMHFSYLPSDDYYTIYLAVKPSDLWEVLCDDNGIMPEDNRQYFNGVVSAFSRYETKANKTIFVQPKQDISIIAEQVYEVIKEVIERECD